ncbi:interleukin-12 subunit alpha [Oxyura jamaicensis]|uniref:interleukin-12 subunit alpha n=1 Tax=Oxyura jamaicensis TaxID=8884 RepID=UPI0015A55229|nr:interleukin-12 subunit alpha [Oxyura jamaicensis]
MEERGTARGTGTGTSISRSAGIGTGTGRGSGHWALLAALCLALPLPAPALPSPPAPSLVPELSRSRALLDAARASLLSLKEHGTLGFDCTLEEVDLKDITKDQINTLKACTSEDPRTGNCPVLESSTFDKRKCLQGIYEDLKAYRAELSDQKVLTSIDEMMKALQPGSLGTLQPPPPSAALTSFKDRMRLCGVLHAFRIRAVTIDRMMNYLSAL